jgi:hypothetical protein
MKIAIVSQLIEREWFDTNTNDGAIGRNTEDAYKRRETTRETTRYDEHDDSAIRGRRTQRFAMVLDDDY